MRLPVLLAVSPLLLPLKPALAQAAPSGTAAGEAAAPAPARPGARPLGQRPPQGGDQTITVTGSRPQVIDAPDRLSFNVANDLAAQTGSLADALRNVPGVEVDLSGNVSLRGDPGVTILIDGRPSAMLRGEGRGDALLSMPANQVERVEVITNPSAALSPEGSGGVINIITRKQRQAGFSGTVRATGGLNGSGSGSLNTALNRPGLTLTGEGSFRRFEGRGSSDQRRERRQPDGSLLRSEQLGRSDNVFLGGNMRGGIELDLDKANRVSAEVSWRRFGFTADRRDTFIGNATEPSFVRTAEAEMNNEVGSVEGSWRRTLGKDHELVTEFEIDRGRRKMEQDAQVSGAAVPLRFERIENKGRRAEERFKVDYKRPVLNGGSLNLGYEVEREGLKAEVLGLFGPSEQQLTVRPGLTNAFDLTETVHAWFGTVSFSKGKWEFQPGLRAEQFSFDLTQRTEGTRFNQEYFRLYPTLHVGRSFGERHKLRASYSRRIQRPGGQELNPFPIYIDPRNQRRGNPLLRPETTDAYELSWQYRRGQTFLSVTGFHRRTENGFTDFAELLPDGTLVTTRANLGQAVRTGLDAILNGRAGPKLSWNLSGTLQRVRLDTDGLGGLEEVRGTQPSVRGSLTWQPSANDFLQLSGNWSGRVFQAQGYRETGGVVNLGYRRRIDERVSLLLTGQDLFNSQRGRTVFRSPTLRDVTESRQRGRVVTAGLTWNFGGTSNRRQRDQGFDFTPVGAGDVGP